MPRAARVCAAREVRLMRKLLLALGLAAAMFQLLSVTVSAGGVAPCC